MSKPATDGEAADAETAAPKKGGSVWPALIAAIVLLPTLSWATTEFLLVPRLRSLIAQQVVEGQGEKGEKGKSSGHGSGAAKHGEKGGKEGESGEISYDFDNVVVNLSGAMGTRYLKASFTTLGSNPDLPKIMLESKKKLLDVAIGVLSARSLADLEAAGSKNVIRTELIANFNQALKSDLVEQIYFTEFVVQ